MADGFYVRVDGLPEILRKFDGLKANVPRIVARAINSTASHVKSLAASDIMEKWNIQKKKDVLATIKITKATVATPTAVVEMSSKPLALPKFGMEKVAIKRKAKPRKVTRIVGGRERKRTISRSYTRYGVKVALLRAQAPEILENAFPARMASGHRGAFIRRSTSSLPILEKKSITPTSMWSDYIDQHLAKAKPYLRARIIGQLESLLAKQGGG